jgi:ATPase subunit of ABC transporter with duplicated ATPase domains
MGKVGVSRDFMIVLSTYDRRDMERRVRSFMKKTQYHPPAFALNYAVLSRGIRERVTFAEISFDKRNLLRRMVTLK